MIITIDGPAASGKSTIARILARNLGYYYLCSGLLYRALSYLLITERGYTLETLNELKQEDINYCFDEKRFSYQYNCEKGEHIFFDTSDITPYLKDKRIDQAASLISIHHDVRHAITHMQHFIASTHDIVIDGRDVGSVIFPHAAYKFFVTARVEIRAQRWQKDQEKYDHHVSLQDAIALITERDDRDTNRPTAPLVIPENAIIVDTSDLSIEQTIQHMLTYIKTTPG